MADIQGVPQLRARLSAITPSQTMMQTLALAAVAEQKRAAPVATGNLRRSIGIGSVTATLAETIASAGYARYVEQGTGVYGYKRKPITPKRGKFLRFEVGGSRLTGKGKGSSVVFAKSVKGRKATPFMLPGAVRAVKALGADVIVKLWNSAA